MLFKENSSALGSLFRISDDLLVGSNRLWVGCITIDSKDIVVVSARPRYRQDGLLRHSLDGFWLALGTTDPHDDGLGYYTELVPVGPLPGADLVGYLKHREHHMDDIFPVRGVYATNTDGTSRLDVFVECVAEQPERETRSNESARILGPSFAF